MKKISLWRGCALVLTCFMVLAMAFYFIAGDQLHYRDDSSSSVSPMEPLGELLPGTELRQSFTAGGDALLWVDVFLTAAPEGSPCQLAAVVVDREGTVLSTGVLAAAAKNEAMNRLVFAEPVPLRRGERYTLRITSPDAVPGSALTLWAGSGVELARGSLDKTITPEDAVRVNGESREDALAFQVRTRTYLLLGRYYWPVAWGLGAALTLLAALVIRRQKAGRSTLTFRVMDAFRRYGYLMRQLVARDFKTKYKRSVLGVFWSFLNPLLTMVVQYLVFSTLFRSDVPNFRLYLLSGIVCFNFFSEAVGMSLMSIVGNASLITKVYVPKYIYPISRVLSSGINLALAMIPLFFMMFLTGTPLRPSVLLLPFGLGCLMVFCIGMGFLLSTSMVFFRDTQFLWGVVSLLWMYLTPIFYPVSIIPDWLMPYYKCNPLYHFIRFVRIVLIDGVSPEPKAYLLCLVAAFVPLGIGALVFRKFQDKFVLNL